MKYEHAQIDKKWQARWREDKTFSVANGGSRPKYYVLDMFPYPSGTGLHVGHIKGYVATDVVSRYKRMRGFEVLHPMGWDAFGLPAERQAAREEADPREVVARNVATFRRQLESIGLSYDWDREFSTTDPRYYRWTQWIFLKLFERGLAYQAEVPVNWCPNLNTVLANEEVQDGKYVETGDPVERRVMRQWMLKITAYADRLIDDLDLLDWPNSVVEMQRNWIGRSEGAEIAFEIKGHAKSMRVFTTRPDTIFGCSFCVLAPEHPLVAEITTQAQRAEVEVVVLEAGQRSERDRISDQKSFHAAFTGAYAISPADGREVQIWIADYVLAHYGEGAVFGCPAHDERDWAFAKQFDLPILEVVSGGDVTQEAYVGDGAHVNSEFLDGLDIAAAKEKVIAWLTAEGHGRGRISYRLRDWLFSRQRYWGEPIPVVLVDGEPVAVPEEELPILLPELDQLQPVSGMAPPLAGAVDWVATVDPRTGAPAERETNTMPQWAGSCWYYLRFADPTNDEQPWSPAAEQRWQPVDLYVGGAEHATLHLLYARFWHKVLFDLGLVSSPEPFTKLFNQGMILAESYRDAAGKYYHAHEVERHGDEWRTVAGGVPVAAQTEKMSKSKCNGISADELVERQGADALRLYEVFIGPLEDNVAWSADGILGVRRFLDRVWRLVQTKKDAPDASAPQLDPILHKTISKVGEDIDKLALNTAVSQLMILVNECNKADLATAEILDVLVRLLAPFAPHLAEEMWQQLGHDESVSAAPWPESDPAKIVTATVTIPVQVNGKVRGRVTVPKGASVEVVVGAALEDERIAQHVTAAHQANTKFVPDRILNFIGG